MSIAPDHSRCETMPVFFPRGARLTTLPLLVAAGFAWIAVQLTRHALSDPLAARLVSPGIFTDAISRTAILYCAVVMAIAAASAFFSAIALILEACEDPEMFR